MEGEGKIGRIRIHEGLKKFTNGKVILELEMNWLLLGYFIEITLPFEPVIFEKVFEVELDEGEQNV